MRLKSLLAGIAAGVATCLYFRFLVDSRLIYYAQEPAFLCDTRFFVDFAAYPGGLVWYASAFLTQMCQFPWAGAAIITLLLFLAVWQTALLFRNMGIGGIIKITALLPGLLFFSLSADYRFPLAYLLGFLFSLTCVNGYFLVAANGRYCRLIWYCVLASVAYYCSGMGVLLVASTCGIDEVLSKRNRIIGVAMLAIAALLPLAAARLLFVISVASAYLDVAGIRTSLLAAAPYARTSPLIYGAYSVVPITSLVMAAASVLSERKKTWGRNAEHVSGKTLRMVIYGAGIIIVFATAFRSLDTKTRQNYHVEAWARNGSWNSIIAAVTPQRIAGFTILSQMHLLRALCHENKLLNNLFTYPDGLPGKAFMVITGKMASRFPVQMCDCCFEIGALNLAEFWANEALAIKGKNARLLERLAMIHALKGRTNSAEKFISLLEKTPFRGADARRCRNILAGKYESASEKELGKIAGYAPRKEYLSGVYYTELVNLVNQNSGNRIAFEYFIAHNLLNNAVGLVVANVKYFAELGYRELPVHVQEAVALQLSVLRDTTVRVGPFKLNSDIVARYSRFNQLIPQFGNNNSTAGNMIMTEFGTTYWFYLIRSGRPVMLKPGGM
jgi:hypothetical protein